MCAVLHHCISHCCGDTICLQVLSIPDNDQLSAQLSTAMRADLLILLSDVDGIYTGHPSDPASRLICTYYPEHENNVKFWGKSRVGKGGMESKVYMSCTCMYMCHESMCMCTSMHMYM